MTNSEYNIEARRTPVPWDKSINASARMLISAKDGQPIAEVLKNNSYDERNANARFIVRACNSHDDLLEALHRLQRKNSNANWIFARAVIAKAKGE